MREHFSGEIDGAVDRQERLWRNFFDYNERRVMGNIAEILAQRARGEHGGRTVGEVFMERGSARLVLGSDAWREVISRVCAFDGDDSVALGHVISQTIFEHLRQLYPNLADAEQFLRDAGDAALDSRIRLNHLVHCGRDEEDTALHIHIDQNFAQDYGSREGMTRMMRDFTDAMQILAKRVREVSDSRLTGVTEIRGSSPLVISASRLLEAAGWTITRHADGAIRVFGHSGVMSMSLQDFLARY